MSSIAHCTVLSRLPCPSVAQEHDVAHGFILGDECGPALVQDEHVSEWPLLEHLAVPGRWSTWRISPARVLMTTLRSTPGNKCGLGVFLSRSWLLHLDHRYHDGAGATAWVMSQTHSHATPCSPSGVDARRPWRPD